MLGLQEVWSFTAPRARYKKPDVSEASHRDKGRLWAGRGGDVPRWHHRSVSLGGQACWAPPRAVLTHAAMVPSGPGILPLLVQCVPGLPSQKRSRWFLHHKTRILWRVMVKGPPQCPESIWGGELSPVNSEIWEPWDLGQKRAEKCPGPTSCYSVLTARHLEHKPLAKQSVNE